MEPASPCPAVPALEAELERCLPKLFGWARALVGGDVAEAEDVLQTAVLRILGGEARFAGRSAFESWAFGVIRRVAGERRRRTWLRDRLIRRWLRPAAVDPSPEVGERLDCARRASRLRVALGRLSTRQREILHLVFYEEMTIAEAAAVVGVSSGSARTHYERGKARLRALLAKEER